MVADERTCPGCGVAFCPLPGRGPRRRNCSADCKLVRDGRRCRDRHTTITVSGRAYARWVAAAAELGTTVADLVEAAVVPALPEVPC
jgi:hypothetical protein